MKALVITSGSYPYGGAASNRHMAYLKGLQELDVEVNMYILDKEKNQSKLSDKKSGNYFGVQYRYIHFNDNKNSNLLNIIFNKITIYRKTKKLLKKEISGHTAELFMLILLINPIDIWPFLKFAKKNKIKVIHERTEFPGLNQNGFIKKQLLKIYYHCIIPKFDGLLLISHALIKHFASKGCDNEKLMHFPMLVDFGRFDKEPKRIQHYGKYIAYCGNMYTDKDGVPNLIKAFDLFCEKINDVNLLLIGDNSNKQNFSIIENEINSSKFKNRIFCTGYIENTEIPDYLAGAALLALARPNNLQAQGGFPTKLGEYLATGKPVIITDVGEHSLYLKNEESAYLVMPDNVELFAEKMIDIFANYNKAVIVGNNGKKIALSYFNYKIQAKRLLEFVKNLK